MQHLPGEVGQHIHGVRAAHARREHPEAARVRRVRVRTDHHAAREGVVLQHHLMNDARARLPEARAVPLRHRLQERVDLVVLLLRRRQVLARAGAGLDEVVAVDGRRHGNAVLARKHELQQRHLRRRVLHRDPVRLQLQIALAGDQVLPMGIVEVSVEDLLRQVERPSQPPLDDVEIRARPRIRFRHKLGGGLNRDHLLLQSIRPKADRRPV